MLYHHISPQGVTGVATDMLSDKQVRSLKATEGKDTVLADGGGLYLRVSKHGSKTFMLRSREGGKARYLTLGSYPALSLADARLKASEMSGKVTDFTVSYAVNAYLAHVEREYADPAQVRRRLERDVVPVIGSMRLAAVEASDVTNLLQKIVDRGSPVAANRTLADVKHLFQFAYGKGWVRHDPTVRITRKVVGGKEDSRDVVPSDEKVRMLIGELRTDRFEPRTRVAMLVILLTGLRASEVLGVSKDEFDGPWWTIPSERTKNGKHHKVYTTHLVRFLLRQVNYTLGGDHRTLSKALRRMDIGFTPHDFRRLMATRLSEKVAPHIIEKMLGHQMEGVMAVYNRAEFLLERKEAGKLWTNIVLRLSRPQ